MKAIFYHKPDSPYDDVTGQKYHFPVQYLSRVEKTIGDWVIYYGPLNIEKGRFYTGVARVRKIRKDNTKENHYYADLEDYLDFVEPVSYIANGGYEKRLVQPDKKINGGYAVQAIRHLEEYEFASIVEAGLSKIDDWPDRFDVDTDKQEDNLLGIEEDQAAFTHAPYERQIIECLTKRKWRDTKFRQNIRVAYNRTCAFTGLRLINGKGRPEIEAAHIRPIEHGGNDSIRNGIALSGTIHWMFDRGLLSLTDEFEILQSRQNNQSLSHILNDDMKAKVPEEIRFQPHPEYLNWHRDNVFKH